MKPLYPLTFDPIFVEKIWGGHKLKSQLNKKCPTKKVGESWEISCIKGAVSQVNNGWFLGEFLDDLIKKYKESLLGHFVYQKYGETFPLLVKFIDASDDLSIQVHPNDSVAKEKHNCFGKNEMWVILNQDNEANLLIGFKNHTTEKEYLEAVNENKLDLLLNKITPKKAEAFYIPTGTVHGIGKGTILAEIQQSSDITYRIYDYNRKDENGNERELHTEEAIKIIDYSSYNPQGIAYNKPEIGQNKIIETPYFKTNYISVQSYLLKDYSLIDSFVIYICIDGMVAIEVENENYTLHYGETILIPACIKNLVLLSIGGGKLLEIYL
jgi:mannose-6-phosphate isomerase